MKMRTKKLTTLLVAAAMSVSALPVASLGASAEDAGGPEYYMYIATATRQDGYAKADSRTIEVSKADLAKGDYTFRAGVFVQDPAGTSGGLCTDSDWPSTVVAMWAPYDAAGNEAWSNIHFTNQTELNTEIPEIASVTLGDGVEIKPVDFPLHALSPLGRGNKYTETVCQEFFTVNEEDVVDGNKIMSDGKGGCYFNRSYYASSADKAAGKLTEDVVTPKVTVDAATDTATLTWDNIDKSTFSPVEVSMQVVDWAAKSALPAGTVMPGKNNSHNWSYTKDKANTFRGAASDELAMFDFDVTIDADTPDGTYYIGFDGHHETTIITKGYKSYWPDNLNFLYTKFPDGTSMVTDSDKNDQAYWLKVVVGDGSAVQTTPTTTTEAPVTTTKAPEVTTTKTPDVNPGTDTGSDIVIGDGYSFVAGEYFVEPGDELDLAPYVYNVGVLPNGITAWGFDFDEVLIQKGVLTLDAADSEGGDAYKIPGALANLEEMHCVAAGSDPDVTFKNAKDEDVLMHLYYGVGDKAAIEAAAKAMGVAVKEDAEHGTYYQFPLVFDPSAPSEEEDVKCVIKVEGAKNYDNLELVNGYINVMVAGLTPSGPTVTTTTEAPKTTTTTTTATTTKPAETTTPAATTTPKTSTTPAATTTPKTTTTVVDPGSLTPFYGDLNLDGKVSVIDVVMLSKAAIGKLDLNAQQKLNANCKKDDKIDSNDVTALLQFVVELVAELPL